MKKLNPLVKIQDRIIDIRNLEYTFGINPDYWCEIEELAEYHALPAIRNLHTDSAMHLLDSIEKLVSELPLIIQNLKHLTMDQMLKKEGKEPPVGVAATESQKEITFKYISKELNEYRTALNEVFQLPRIEKHKKSFNDSNSSNKKNQSTFQSNISFEQWLQIYQLAAYENEDGEDVLLFKPNIPSDIFADHVTKFLEGEEVSFLKIELQSKLVGLITVMDWLDHKGFIKNWIELITALGIYAGRKDPISKKSLTQTKFLLKKNGFDVSRYYSKVPKPLNRKEIGEQTPSVIVKKLCAQLHQIFPDKPN